MEVAVDQVHHRAGEGEAVAVADRIHHPEIHISEMAQGPGFTRQGKEVAGMGIGVEVAEFQELLQPGNHSRADQRGGIEVLRFQFLALLQLGALDPGGGDHPLG